MSVRHLGLKVLFLGMSLLMIGATIYTSIASNLFVSWPRLSHEPWMTATLIDFYFNITIISSWMFYREKSIFKGILWLLAFILLGSIATGFYVFLQISSLKPEEPIQNIFKRLQ